MLRRLLLVLAVIAISGCTAFDTPEGQPKNDVIDDGGGGDTSGEDTSGEDTSGEDTSGEDTSGEDTSGGEDMDAQMGDPEACRALCNFRLTVCGEAPETFSLCVEECTSGQNDLLSCQVGFLASVFGYESVDDVPADVGRHPDDNINELLCETLIVDEEDEANATMKCEQLGDMCDGHCAALEGLCCEKITGQDDPDDCEGLSALWDDCGGGCRVQTLADNQRRHPAPFICQTEALAALDSLPSRDPNDPEANPLPAIQSCAAANPALPGSLCSYDPCGELCANLVGNCQGYDIIKDYGITPGGTEANQLTDCRVECARLVNTEVLVDDNTLEGFDFELFNDTLQCRALSSMIAGFSHIPPEILANPRTLCNFSGIDSSVCPVNMENLNPDNDHIGGDPENGPLIFIDDFCPYVANSVDPNCNGDFCSAESPNCDGAADIEDPSSCEDLSSDPLNCGGCGIDCMGATCEDHECTNMVPCGPGDSFFCSGGEVCDGGISCLCGSQQTAGGSLCSDDERCDSANEVCVCGDSGAGCGPNDTCCDDACVDTWIDSTNCGACGVVCEGTCIEGSCVEGTDPPQDCDPGLAWCTDGCFDLSNDVDHCGQCGDACGDGFTCIEGRCTCNPYGGTGYLCPDCNGDTDCAPGTLCLQRVGAVGKSCINPVRSFHHCSDGSGSGEPCGDGEVCERGRCACGDDRTTAGGGVCSGAPVVCEEVTGEASASCGQVCELICSSGDQRACGSGTADCSCFDIRVNPEHCGGCGITCVDGDVCVEGACVPEP